jgi:hypothetical protein
MAPRQVMTCLLAPIDSDKMFQLTSVKIVAKKEWLVGVPAVWVDVAKASSRST